MSKPSQKGARKPSLNARKTAARLVAAQLVYGMMLTGQSAQEALADYRDHRSGETIDDVTYVPAEFDLLSAIVRGVADRRVDLVDMLQATLMAGDAERSQHPELLLRSILLCGAYELMAHADTDTALLIAEYKHVTHGFFEGDEGKLVQAVLDKIGRALRGA